MIWTKPQLDAIESRGNTLLISAGAGSGKTAVLTARILSLLQEGASLDDFLIVTFTKAAAGEMRERIARELYDAASAGDRTLAAQALRVERADITTLHGFCAKVCREYFHAVRADPMFRVMDEPERNVLVEKAMNEALLSCFEAPTDCFFYAAECLTQEQLKEAALSLFQFIQTRPDSFEWLDRMITMAENLAQDENPAQKERSAQEKNQTQMKTTAQPFETSIWVRELLESAKFGLGNAMYLYQSMLAKLDGYPKYQTFVLGEIENCDALLREIPNGLSACLQLSKKKASKKPAKAKDADEAFEKWFIDTNKKAQKAVKEACDLIEWLGTADARKEEIETGCLILRGLEETVRRFDEVFTRMKAERNRLDYNDLEHYAYEALHNDDIALTYQKKYAYVFVDEYQDSSLLQEAIIQRVCREGSLFMVGDVKQSIYRFRQAEPSLFLEKLATYSIDRDAPYRSIFLNENFRSHPNILCCINDLFERVFWGKQMEITYDQNAKLTAGKTWDIIKEPVELHVIQRSGESLSNDEEISAETESFQRDLPNIESLRQDSFAAEPHQHYSGKTESTRQGSPEAESHRCYSGEAESTWQGSPDAGSIQSELPETESARHELRRAESCFQNFLRIETIQRNLSNIETHGQNSAKTESIRQDKSNKESISKDLTETESTQQGFEETETIRQEARVIADRIVALQNAENGYQLSEMAILLRVMKGKASHVADVLRQSGIAAKADIGEDTLSQVEIQDALSLLKTIDNFHQDIPLIAALKGPAVGLSSEDIANIRVQHPQGSFAEAMIDYAERDDVLAEALRGFRSEIAEWALEALVCPLDSLIRKICEQKRLFQIAGAMPDGRIRQEHLYLLAEAAAIYQQQEDGGLGGFLRYIGRVQKKDGLAAQNLGERENAVRILSIHKSKGLQFQIVFVAGLGSMFSFQDSSDMLQAHPALGVGIHAIDPVLRLKQDTMIRKAIVHRKKTETMAEQARILYVALTRAKNRLVLVGTVEKNAEEYRNTDPRFARSFLQWILPVAMNGTGWIIRYHSPEPGRPAQRKRILQRIIRDIREAEKPFAGGSVALSLSWKPPGVRLEPLKQSVTQRVRETDGAYLQRLEDLPVRPFFLEREGLNAAEIGEATHVFLRSIAAFERDFDAACRTIVEKGILTEEQADALPVRELQWFLNHALWQRISGAARMHREWAFNLRQEHDGDSTLLQGVIDCCFIENQQWVLVDYKTDHADENTIIERHKTQVILYADALERLTGIRVKEKILFAVALGKALAV